MTETPMVDTHECSGETLLCAAPPPPLIAICCPYLEPARFARQNLSVEIPFYLAQIRLNHKYCGFVSGTLNSAKEIVKESAYFCSS